MSGAFDEQVDGICGEMEAAVCLSSSHRSSGRSSPLKERPEDMLEHSVDNSDSRSEKAPLTLDAGDVHDSNVPPQLDVVKSSTSHQVDNSRRSPSSQEYTATVDYGRKLGYDENLIHSILRRRGSSISRDELLKELIENDRSMASGSFESKSEQPLFSASLTGEPVSCSKDERQMVRGDSASLRPIIIDGSNVAMSHGNKKMFSCRGIEIAVDWFKQRGHAEITVFVPQWRKENAKQASQITNQEILSALEQEKIVVFTPSRRVNNKRIVCYDDRYVLKLAAENGGIVVSNDNYRDLLSENTEFKKVIEERLLMYSFVNDRFMPPDDPLGRHGPSLDSFLQMNPTSSNCLSLQPCPYARKCTYGTKCKFYHAGRPQRLLAPLSTQITEEAAHDKVKELKQRGFCGVFCNEKSSLGGKNSFSSNTSPSEMADLSPIAISLLAGGKNQYRPVADGGLGRHSLPLPWPSTLGIKHESLRPVHSDPSRPYQPAGCSGHLALAKKISTENCLAQQQQRRQQQQQQQQQQNATYDRVSSSEIQWSNTEMKMDEFMSENRHSLLCRKPSVGTIFEAQKSSLPVKKSFDALPLDGSVLYSGNGGLSTNWNENIPDVFTERVHLSRMRSEPLLSQSDRAHEKDQAISASPSRPQRRQEVPLHRVGTFPLVQKHTTALSYLPERDFAFGSYQRNPVGMSLHGHNLLSSSAIGNCRDGNGWTSFPQMENPTSSLSEFSQINKRSSSSSSASSAADPSSRNWSKCSPIQQTSTFHFGQNSSYQFVPALLENVIIPPYGSPCIPPGFSVENSCSANSVLFVALSLLFDAEDVCQVLAEHPNEMNLKVLCCHLLQLYQQKKQQHVL